MRLTNRFIWEILAAGQGAAAVLWWVRLHSPLAFLLGLVAVGFAIRGIQDPENHHHHSN
jgi:hypothetical protein